MKNDTSTTRQRDEEPEGNQSQMNRQDKTANTGEDNDTEEDQ